MLRSQIVENIFKHKVFDKYFLGIVCIITFLYYAVFVYTEYARGFIYNSDFEFYTMCGRDIFQGNIFLQDWFGSTNTYYFLAIIYGLCGWIFGYDVKLMILVCALLFTFMTGLVCYVILKMNDTVGLTRYVKTIFALSLMLASCYAREISGIFAGSHFDSAVIAFLLFYMIANYYEREKVNKFFFVIIYMLLFLGYLSDSLTILFTVVPMLLVVVGNLFLNKLNKRKKQILIVNMLVIVGVLFLSRIVLKTWNGISVPYEVNSISTVDYSELFSRVGFCVETLFYLFGGDWFDVKLSAFKVDCLLLSIVVVFFVILLFIQRRHWIKNIFYQMCFATVMVSVLILCLTEYAELGQGVAYTSRLLPLCFFCCIVLFLGGGVDFKLLTEKCNLKMKHINWIIFLCAIYFGGSSVKDISFGNKIDTDNKYRRIADVLLDEGLSDGFATYWISFPVIMESGYSVNITSVDGKDTSFVAWLNKKPLETAYANFIIFDDSGWGGVDGDTITNTVGIPDNIIDIDDIHIYIWDKNIMPLIKNMQYAAE